MPSLHIPEEALPDFKKIAEVDQEVFDSLLAAIKETGPTLTRDQFEKKIAGKIKFQGKADLAAILRATLVLYRFREFNELSAQGMAEAVVDSRLISTSEDFSAEKRESLRKRLSLLLDFDQSLGVTSKAFDVMTENERVFCDARILSDLRPVFAAGKEEALGAVIIHNLRIGFHRAGKHQELYFALDTDDIQKLKEVIERAGKKTAVLESILRKSGVPYLEV